VVAEDEPTEQSPQPPPPLGCPRSSQTAKSSSSWPDLRDAVEDCRETAPRCALGERSGCSTPPAAGTRWPRGGTRVTLPRPGLLEAEVVLMLPAVGFCTGSGGKASTVGYPFSSAFARNMAFISRSTLPNDSTDASCLSGRATSGGVAASRALAAPQRKLLELCGDLSRLGPLALLTSSAMLNIDLAPRDIPGGCAWGVPMPASPGPAEPPKELSDRSRCACCKATALGGVTFLADCRGFIAVVLGGVTCLPVELRIATSETTLLDADRFKVSDPRVTPVPEAERRRSGAADDSTVH